MASCLLKKRGFTLLEVTVIVFIVGVLLSMVMPSYISRINQAKYEKTVSELSTIAKASVDYFNLEGTWPDPTKWASQLYPQFIPDGGKSINAVTSSPFGTSYNISYVNNIATAYVLIPSGIAQKNEESPLLEIIPQSTGNQDLIRVTHSIKNESTGRLNYCLNNLC
jgi:general secretion pathway protein G